MLNTEYFNYFQRKRKCFDVSQYLQGQVSDQKLVNFVMNVGAKPGKLCPGRKVTLTSLTTVTWIIQTFPSHSVQLMFAMNNR